MGLGLGVRLRLRLRLRVSVSVRAEEFGVLLGARPEARVGIDHSVGLAPCDMLAQLRRTAQGEVRTCEQQNKTCLGPCYASLGFWGSSALRVAYLGKR